MALCCRVKLHCSRKYSTSGAVKSALMFMDAPYNESPCGGTREKRHKAQRMDFLLLRGDDLCGKRHLVLLYSAVEMPSSAPNSVHTAMTVLLTSSA